MWAENATGIKEFVELLCLVGIFGPALSKVGAKLQRITSAIFSCVENVAEIMNSDEESVHPDRAIYIISFLLLISLAFLSPDRIPTAFSSSPVEIGVFDKIQEMAKIIKRIIPSLG